MTTVDTFLKKENTLIISDTDNIFILSSGCGNIFYTFTVTVAIALVIFIF